MQTQPLSTAALSLCVALSAGTAWTLHHAGTRADAADVVPLLVLWGLAALTACRGAPRTSTAIILMALAVRLPLVGTPPLLSDDIYRYLWEGGVLADGYNPVTTPPAFHFNSNDDNLLAKVAHPEISSVYPPIAMVWFVGLSLLDEVWTAQLLTALVDVCTAWLILKICIHKRLAAWPAVLYALHPLPAVESAAGAHIDILAVAFTTWAIHRWETGDRESGVVLAGAGTLTKVFPVLLLPTMLRVLPAKRAAILGIGLLVVSGIALAPFSGHGALRGWSAYAGHWWFNPFAGTLLRPLLGEAARPVLVLVAGAIMLAGWWRETDPTRLWLWAGTTFVLFSPTVHPWYLLWALVPSLLVGSPVWGAAAIPLLASYLVLRTTADPGGWAEQWWLAPVTWGGALAFAAGISLAGRRLGVVR